MSLKEILALISGILFLIAFIPYIKAILKNEIKPEKVTWIIWLTLDVVTAFGMHLEGILNFQISAAVTGAGIVAILALFKSKSLWTTLDKVCLFIASIAILLLIFSDAKYALSISLFATVVGAIPTFISAWNTPENEDKTAWIIFWISCLFSVAGADFNLLAQFQPLTFLFIESVVVYSLFIRVRWI